MTPTRSKKEELEELLYDVYAHGYAGAQRALDGLSVREALPRLEKIIASRITQALKELKEEKKVVDVFASFGITKRIEAVPVKAIDNKIKALEESNGNR